MIGPHTASLAQPPRDALDTGAAWEIDDGAAEDEEHGLQVLADLAAERELKALEVKCERNGIAWSDLPGRGRVGVKEASAEPGTLLYFAMENLHPDSACMVARGRVVELLSEHFREVEG
jgi:hypothetical protein